MEPIAADRSYIFSSKNKEHLIEHDETKKAMSKNIFNVAIPAIIAMAFMTLV